MADKKNTSKKSPQKVTTKKKTVTKKEQQAVISTAKKAVRKVKKLPKAQKITVIVIALVLIAAIVFTGIYFRNDIVNWFNSLNKDPATEENPDGENGDDVGNGTQGTDGRYSVDGFQNTEFFGTAPTLLDLKVNIYFVNVGQGSSLFIIFDDGTTMLADAGVTAAKGYVDKKGAETNLLSLLRKLNLTYIDYVMATHPDADHVNLLSVVFDNFQVNCFIYNDIPSADTTATYNTLRTKALAEPNSTQMKIAATGFSEDYDKDGSTVTETITGGDTSITMYAPGYSNTAAGFSSHKNDKNSMSPICILQYKTKKMLFTGDSTITTEKWFLDVVREKPSANFDIDILFVGHHGSNTSSSPEFLDFIKAEYAVISSGAGNSYRHPTLETMAKLKTRGIVTYRTDSHGTIELRLDSQGAFGFLPQNRVFTFANTKGISDLMLAA